MEAALRELSEETGIAAEKIEPLDALYTSPALIDEIIYMYIATGLSQGEQHLDDDEFVNAVKIPLNEAIDMVMSGKILDAKTQLIILKAAKYLENK
jgi:ADP-ribose pyrophosphatase